MLQILTQLLANLARGKSTDAGHLAQKTQQVRDKTPTVAQKNALNKNKESQKTAVKSVPTAQKGQNKGGKPAATPPHKLPPQVTAAPPPPRPAAQKNPKKKHTPQDLVVTINLIVNDDTDTIEDSDRYNSEYSRLRRLTLQYDVRTVSVSNRPPKLNNL
ncbi:hypothetical protein M8J75_001267 [Diaphorina citri]|nr:hypothetical protein M8J75_001267 [Diaphorina citri]